MIRILYLTARADIGGGQECLYQLAAQTCTRSEVYIAAPREEPYWGRFESLLGPDRLIEIPHRKLSLSALRKLSAFLDKQPINVIHSHGFGAGLYGRVLAITNRVPCAHTFHGLVFRPSKPLWSAARLLTELGLSAASTSLIAVSSSEEQHLKRWLFPFAGKFQKIHNGIPPRSRISSSTSQNAPVQILWVGRMHEQKDPLQVLEIAKHLSRFVPHDEFCIDMVGDGPLMPEVRRRIAQDQLERVVRLKGGSSNMDEHYRRSQILLSTSSWEGLPTCILEAMQAGLLVIASAVRGNLDLVEHGCTGLLYDKQSALQGAQLLSAVVKGDIARSTIVQRARERVDSEFGLERFANQHWALYQSIAKTSFSPGGVLSSRGSEPSLPRPDPSSGLRVAIVHEWLVSYAGSEKVVEEMLSVFPNADLFTLVDFLPKPDRSFLNGTRITTSFLQRLPFAKKLFRTLLWLLPLAVESFDLTSYDIIVSSSHAVAKGVITGPCQLHVCYCHSPIRYAWDHQHEYLRQAGLTRGLRSLYARLVLHYIRLWDIRTANGVDSFVANSRFIAKRINKVYRREAAVIHPPVNVQDFAPQEQKDDYYLTVCRLVPYKRVDLIAAAFGQMPDKKLVVIGDGPNFQSWRQQAPANVEFLGRQPDQVVQTMMSRAKAFLFAAEEDFGITLVEAQACGTPVICFGKGGALDSVIPGVTGLFFAEQTCDSIKQIVKAFEDLQASFDPAQIQAHARGFSSQRFRMQFRAHVLEEARRHGIAVAEQGTPFEVNLPTDIQMMRDLVPLGGALVDYQARNQPSDDRINSR